MTPDDLFASHRAMWKRAFSPAHVAERLFRGARRLRPGALMLSAAMNGFYGLKRLTNNPPADPPAREAGRIRHPEPDAHLIRAQALRLPASNAAPLVRKKSA